MTKANISWITDNLATGGDLSYDDAKATAQFQDLLGQDIDLIIDCREEADDDLLWANTHISYLYLPTQDAHGFDIPDSHYDRAVEAALPVLEGGGKVFVHCHMGVNRGPSTAFAIMLAQGWRTTKAFDLIREKRPQAGLYYAEGALRAHLARKNIGWGTREYSRRMIALKDHIHAVMSPSVRQSIQHVIRTGHATDRAERMAFVS